MSPLFPHVDPLLLTPIPSPGFHPTIVCVHGGIVALVWNFYNSKVKTRAKKNKVGLLKLASTQ